MRQIIQRPFAQNVATVATGTAIAQIVGIVFYPIITRLYGPEAFGVLSAFGSIGAVLVPLAALSFPIAIVLPKSELEAIALVKVSLYLSFIFSSLIALLLLILGDELLGLLGLESVLSLKHLIPVNMLFASWLLISQQWLIRKNLFKLKAKASIINAILTNSSKAGIGFFCPTATVLVGLTSLGHAAHVGLVYLGINRRQNPWNPYGMRSRHFWFQKILKHYSHFPLYHLPRTMLNRLAQSMPILFLSAFFGPFYAGVYALSKYVLYQPSMLISHSVGTVFYPKISEFAIQGKSLKPLIFKSTLSLAILGVLPFFSIILVGPKIFGFVFGEEWGLAGEYARWMSFWMFSDFIKTPSSYAIIVLKQQRLMLVLHLFTLTLRVIALSFGFLVYNSALVAIIGFAMIGLLHNILSVLLAFIKSHKSDQNINC